MRLRARRSTTFITLSLALVGLFIVVMTVLWTIQRTAYAQPVDGRLITVYDRGNERVFLSQAESVGAALSEAGIEVDGKDAVEPAREEALIASEYHINIYRARPVTVVDGQTRQRIVTPYQTPERIVSDAGIQLLPEDKAAMSRSDDLLSDGAGLQVTIDRAIPMVLDLYGKKTDIRTQGATIAEMLSEKAIKLGANDRTSLTLDTPVTPGLEVRIWREGRQTVTVDETLPFSTEQIKDADRPFGYKEVKTEGREGKRAVTYEILVENGAEVSRSEIAAIILQPTQNQVELVGAKSLGTSRPASENEQIAWNFLVAQGFTREQAAGIMGNLMQEHRFNTGDVPGGLGIAQWLGARRANLMARDGYLDIYVQLQFLMDELNGGESKAKAAVLASATVEQATVAFSSKFERCGLCRDDLRIKYAYDILASH